MSGIHVGYLYEPIWNPVTNQMNYAWITDDDDVQWVNADVWMYRHRQRHPPPFSPPSSPGPPGFPEELEDDMQEPTGVNSSSPATPLACPPSPPPDILELDSLHSATEPGALPGIAAEFDAAAAALTAPAHGSAAAGEDQEEEQPQQQQRRSRSRSRRGRSRGSLRTAEVVVDAVEAAEATECVHQETENAPAAAAAAAGEATAVHAAAAALPAATLNNGPSGGEATTQQGVFDDEDDRQDDEHHARDYGSNDAGAHEEDGGDNSVDGSP